MPSYPGTDSEAELVSAGHHNKQAGPEADRDLSHPGRGQVLKVLL